MKQSFVIFILSCLSFTLTTKAQETGPLVLHSMADYQVIAISENGKWACGVYTNAANMYYAFRWNLVSGETILLSSGDCLSEANAVSNDGTVVGSFDNTEATANGAPAYTAGYWKDGAWHHLPNIGNAPVSSNDEVGYAYAISSDGKYIAGSYNDKESVCIPVIWENGKVAHTFGGTGYDGMLYTVTRDGQRAAGWSITPNSEQARVATLWEVGKGSTLMMDERLSNAWCSARKFSPNGKYLLYWEGYYDVPADQITDPNASNMGLWALYNVETGEKTGMPTITRDPYNFDVYDITDNGTIVGYEQSDGNYVKRAVIFKDGKTRYMEDYLEEKGIDIDGQKLIMPISEEDGTRHIFCGQGISADENTYAVLYYDTIGAVRSMVVKLNENLTSRPPVGLKVNKLSDVSSVRLEWNAPLAGSEGVIGYNVYRSGKKINANPLTEKKFWDSNLLQGNHTYTVTALYATGESQASEAVEVAISERSVAAPRSLFARQKGVNDAIITWDIPQSNLPRKQYYPEETEVTGFGGGTNSFEVAIRFDAAEMSLYKGHYIHSVSFYPMSRQQKWTINLYKKEQGKNEKELFYTQDVATETLQYGVQNNIKLNTPVSIPENAELYVAIAVTVSPEENTYNVIGEVRGEARFGYSDLVKTFAEDDFYSLYDDAMKNSYEVSTSWAVSVMLAAEDMQAVDKIDAVTHYNVYDADVKLGQTEEQIYVAKGLAEGVHTLGVEAVYADGRVSPRTTRQLQVESSSAVYKGIDQPRIALTGTHDISVEWDVPVDDDETHITYSGEETQGGVVGPSDSFGYMAAAIYGADKLNSYGGYRIKAFRFYPLADAVFTFYLHAGGQEVCQIDVEQYALNHWNTVELETPLFLQPGLEYRLELDCYDVLPGAAPLGLDCQMPFTGISDIYSLDEGLTFASVNQASVYGNWMIGMVLVSEESSELPVVGYDVRIDTKKVNESLLTEPRFSYTFPADAKTAHRINVDVHYDTKGIVEGTPVFFNIGPDAIEEQPVKNSEVCFTHASGCITVHGVSRVQNITLCTTAGLPVASARTNSLDVSHLPAGIYLLQICADEKTQCVKFVISE